LASDSNDLSNSEHSKNSNDSKFKVALIGFGIAGAIFHAPFIRRIANLKLAAIVTSDPQRAGQAKSEYPEAKIFSRAEEIFSSASDYNLLVIAAPNKFHYPICVDALNAGMSVVVDKPMATSSQQIRELIELSRKQNKLLSVYQNRRWDADFLTLQKIIANDSLGKLTRFESRFERFRPEPKKDAWRESADVADAGGLLFDLGSHLIDQTCVLFGRPDSVYAEVRTLRSGAGVDDDVFVALNFPSQMVAHVWASSVASSPAPRFRLSGLKGSFEKYGLDPQEDALRAGRRPDSAEWGEESDSSWGHLYLGANGVVTKEKVVSERGNYGHFYANVASTLAGRGQLEVKPEQALLTTEIIEAAFKSSKNGRVEPVGN
jgi:scyllo-inositol 2-dehydrogenase (NADP+)